MGRNRSGIQQPGDRLLHLLVIASLLGVAGLGAGEARSGRKGGGGQGEGRMPVTLMRTEVPAVAYDLVLGRPTRDTITVSVLAYAAREGFLVYGTQPGKYDRETPPRTFAAGEPVEIELSGLSADTRHYYRLRSRPVGASAWEDSVEGTFMTARPPGAAFTFTVQADPHLDYGTDPAVYRKSLANALAARTDFHVDLGDTFMTDKYPKFTAAAPQYLAQRHYFSLLGPGAPVFLVLGNHDGEQPGRGGDGPESMAVWSNGMRKKYFPNPVPNAFYTGNATPDRHAGLLENYYAWEWGDALFVALDPFWYSTRARGRDGSNWSRTLGEAQYRWLERTLAQSTAKYCFVFIHHLAGGETPEGRGGAEAARFFEWGGHDLDGRNTFAQHRPGWTAPIHELLVRRGGGCVVFHGHDHLYAQQERDGIIYQLVPQPGHQRFDNTRSAAEYGYKSGVIQGASGIMRVSVAAERAVVEYVRAYPDSAENATRRTGSVSHRYVVSPRAVVSRRN
ncbi:MAG: metallophosphoesterase family protein [Opitutaceae bacterium]|nr:metallophosphoesterase family protein [Opitutaceae bacterium]